MQDEKLLKSPSSILLDWRSISFVALCTFASTISLAPRSLQHCSYLPLFIFFFSFSEMHTFVCSFFFFSMCKVVAVTVLIIDVVAHVIYGLSFFILSSHSFIIDFRSGEQWWFSIALCDRHNFCLWCFVAIWFCRYFCLSILRLLFTWFLSL